MFWGKAGIKWNYAHVESFKWEMTNAECDRQTRDCTYANTQAHTRTHTYTRVCVFSKKKGKPADKGKTITTANTRNDTRWTAHSTHTRDTHTRRERQTNYRTISTICHKLRQQATKSQQRQTDNQLAAQMPQMYSNFLPPTLWHTLRIRNVRTQTKASAWNFEYGQRGTNKQTDSQMDRGTHGVCVCVCECGLCTVTHIFRCKSHFNNCETTNLLQLEMDGKMVTAHTATVGVPWVAVQWA